MTMWRNRQLESLVGGTLDAAGLTAARLESLVKEQVPETDLLEFKGRAYSSRGSVDATPRGGKRDSGQEFAKDVAALANHRGGLLLLGVTERNGRADKLTPLTGNPDEEQRWLRVALGQFLAPVADVDLVTIPMGNDEFGIGVVVPPSIRAPHAVLAIKGADAKNPLSYPERDGTATRWLHEQEVAERYHRRSAAGRAQAQVLQSVVSGGRARLESSGGGYSLYVAAVPEVGAQRRLDRAAVEANHQWVRRQAIELLGSSRDLLFDQLQVRAAPGRTILGRFAPDGLCEPYLELHATGSAFVACSVADLREYGSRSNGGQMSLWSLTTIAIAVIDLAGRWVADQATVPGTARLEAGLIHGGSPGGVLPRTELMSAGMFNEMTVLPGTEPIGGVSPTVETVYPLMVATGTRGAVEVASAVMDGLVQWFGLGDCPYLQPDGSVVPGRGRQHEQATAWALRYGVNVQVRD